MHEIIRFLTLCILCLSSSLCFSQLRSADVQRTIPYAVEAEKRIIDFDKDQKHLMFTLTNYGIIVPAGTIPNTFKFDLYGVSSSGIKIDPIVSSMDVDADFIEVNGNSFEIDPRLASEINIYFESPIVKIIVDGQSVIINQLKFDHFHTLTGDTRIANPEIEDCIRDVVLLVDASASMKDDEISNINEGIGSWLNTHPSLLPDLNISIVKFDSKADILVKNKNLIEKSTAAKLVNAIESIDQENQSLKLTSWAEGLKIAEGMDADLVILITDAPPNAINYKRADRVKAVSEAVEIANKIKINGTRILAIGKQEITVNNAMQWFSFITSYDKSTFIDLSISNEIDKVLELDYVLVENFKQIEFVLSGIADDCPKKLNSNTDALINIQVFPCPAIDVLHFSPEGAQEMGVHNYKIMTSDGKVVQSGEIDLDVGALDINKLISGQYIVELISAESEKSYKSNFIKIN